MNRRCIHCEAVLPTGGDCTACTVARSPEVLPAFLSRSLLLDRRAGERESFTAAGSIDRVAPPPAIPPLAVPVGMTPRADCQDGTTVLQRRRTPISLEALAPPLPARPTPLPMPAIDVAPQRAHVDLTAHHDLELELERFAPRAPNAATAAAEAGAAAFGAEQEEDVAPHADVVHGAATTEDSDEAFRARLAARLAAHMSSANHENDAAELAQEARDEGDDSIVAMTSGTEDGDDDSMLRARPAQFWRRGVASAVDGALVLSVGALYLGLAQAVAGTMRFETLVLPGLALLALVAAVYATVGSLWGGCTLGQRVAGIRLVDGHGRAPAPTVALARALLGAVSAGLLGVGFWLALVDRRGQTLHDKLTSTFIVQPI